MADQFCIKVRCTNCGAETTLTAENGGSTPLLFDDLDVAFFHASRLRKKPARLFGAINRSMGVEGEGDTTYECSECNAIFRMRDLKPTPFRYQSE